MFAEVAILKTIKELRIARDWTQMRLASEAGVSLPSVGKIEKSMPVSKDVAESVCRALDVEMKDVTGIVIAQRLR